MSEEKKLCRNCKHFYVTYDPRMPNGCRVYGITSKELPSAVVDRSNGQKNSCLGYTKKKK